MASDLAPQECEITEEKSHINPCYLMREEPELINSPSFNESLKILAQFELEINEKNMTNSKVKKENNKITSENESKNKENFDKENSEENDAINNSSNFIEFQCYFCLQDFAAKKDTIIKCSECLENFCVRHRKQINHNCQKLNPNMCKYLMAKNLIQERMRAIKAQGH